MNNRISHIAICLMFIIGCVSQRNILNPIDDMELREISDNIIYKEISSKYHNNLIFNGAFKGFQCYPEIVDTSEFERESYFEKYQPFECYCYDYKIKTDQGSDLYVGVEYGFYLNTKVCYNSNKEIIDEPKTDNLQKCLNNAKVKHINLSEVKLITENEVKIKSNFGKWPVLVYQTNQERLIWKVKRHYGKLNVTVHEFDIDAVTGEIVKNEKLPYRRTFWQWIGGTGI